MWFWFFLQAADAQGCPAIPELVASAREAYEIAELDDAREALADAGDALACQDRLVGRDTLLDLFLLTAQVAFTLDDEPRTETALERAVAVDARPSARPTAPYSPELAAEWDRIADRLGRDLAEVRVTGAGKAFVDGRETDASRPLRVAKGLHLVQVPEADGYRSDVLLVLSDYVIATPGRAPTALPMPAPEPRTRPTLPPSEPLLPPKPDRRRGRTRTIVAGTVGGLFGATAAFTLLSGAVSERSFRESTYNGPVVPFYGIPRGDPRYEEARQRIIEFDARNINLLYGIGYTSAAISGALLTVAVLPSKRARAATTVPPTRR